MILSRIINEQKILSDLFLIHLGNLTNCEDVRIKSTQYKHELSKSRVKVREQSFFYINELEKIKHHRIGQSKFKLHKDDWLASTLEEINKIASLVDQSVSSRQCYLEQMRSRKVSIYLSGVD